MKVLLYCFLLVQYASPLLVPGQSSSHSHSFLQAISPEKRTLLVSSSSSTTDLLTILNGRTRDLVVVESALQRLSVSTDFCHKVSSRTSTIITSSFCCTSTPDSQASLATAECACQISLGAR